MATNASCLQKTLQLLYLEHQGVQWGQVGQVGLGGLGEQ